MVYDTDLNSSGDRGGSEEPHPQAGTRAYLGVRRGERRSDNEGIHLKANWHLFFERRSLIYEHNRYIVLYPVKKFTLVTDQAVSRAVEMYVALALGTAQDIEQFLLDWHAPPLYLFVLVAFDYRGHEKIAKRCEGTTRFLLGGEFVRFLLFLHLLQGLNGQADALFPFVNMDNNSPHLVIHGEKLGWVFSF